MKLMPLAFVVQLVVVIGPHQMWKAYAGPKLKQFFSMTLSIARYRDRKTGLFSSVTIETVKRLRDDFGRQDDVVKSYERKLTLQLIFAAASAAGISAASLLLQPGKAFDTTFICRLESSDYGKYWLERQRQYCLNSSCFSLNQTAVPCTYSFPVVLLPLWVSNLVLLAVIAALALWGMIWRRSSHWEMLDFEGKADFFYALCVNTAKYEPSDSWKKQCTIKTNLDLFLSMLYATDKGHGETFHDVLVSLSLDERWKRDRALHASVKLVEQAKRSALHEFLRKKVIDRLKRLEKPKFSLGLHIYSGSNGAAIHLVNHFENLIAIDLNCHYNPLHDRELRGEQTRDTEQRDGVLKKGFKGLDLSSRPRKPLYTFEYEGLEEVSHMRMYCVPDNFMSRSPSQISWLTVELNGNRRSDADKSAVYDFVIITQLEENEASRENLDRAPKLLSVRLFLKNIENLDSISRAGIVFCFHTEEEIETLTKTLKCLRPNPQKEKKKFVTESSSVEAVCWTYEGCTKKEWEELNKKEETLLNLNDDPKQKTTKKGEEHS
ncbi:uncharacterized protein [Oscarella lobularis]|uniref:uncharacterized protein n=1 Tax=Oscarella lobularis TaxID=121494 RepID=UPI003314035F